MKRHALLLVIFTFLLLLGVVGITTRPSPRVMTVQLSGTPGLSVAGSYIADGGSNSFSGVLPTNFTVRARKLTYTIRKQESQGELVGRLYIDGVEAGLSSTPATNAGVKGWAERDGFLLFRRDGFGFTTIH